MDSWKKIPTIHSYKLFKCKITINQIMKNSYIIVLFFTVLISCNTKDDSSSFKKFPNKIELEGNKIKTNQKFKSTNIVGIIDSILIVEVGLNDYAFYFFNINNFSLIKKFGKISRAPGEFPGGVSACYLDNNKKMLFASNRAKSIIYKASIDSILERDSYTPKVFMKIPPKYSALDGLNILNDTTLIITGILNYDLLILNENGKIIKKIGQLPSKPPNIKSRSEERHVGKECRSRWSPYH